MLTCLCDAFFGEVGIATVRVLESLGCEVHFNDRQTCCGQPPFNSGNVKEARLLASRALVLFPASHGPVVVPSGSCAAMVTEGYEHLGLSPLSAFELAQFIVRELGISVFPSVRAYPRKVAFHSACHGRIMGLRGEQRLLLESLPGLRLVEFSEGEQCCGFGGSFTVSHGKLSSEIGRVKLEAILASGAEEIVSGDMGCLMHLQGLIARENLPLRTRHFAEVLAEVSGP